MKKFLIGLLIVLGMVSTSFAGNIEINGINQGDLYTLLDNLTYSRMYQNLGGFNVTANNVASTNFQIDVIADTTTVSPTLVYVNNGYLYALTVSSDIKSYTKSTASSVKRTYSAIPTSYFVLNVNGSGAYYITSSYGNYLPPKLDGYTPLGGAIVALDSDNTAGFTLGTTAWNAASQNVTFFNLSAYPTGASKVTLTGL